MAHDSVLAEQPRVLSEKWFSRFIEGVVADNDSVQLICDLQQQSVASPNCAGGGLHKFAVIESHICFDFF
jgi:hypothetical protein